MAALQNSDLHFIVGVSRNKKGSSNWLILPSFPYVSDQLASKEITDGLPFRVP